jgi:oligoribonuclease
MAMAQDENNLIWIDLEMTGLDPFRDQILEIATLVTDARLKSGLIERVRASAYDEQQAERDTVAFLEQYVPAGVSPMCGNSICQDRRFLARCMPKLEAFFHYRNLDVSSLKELARRWMPAMAAEFVKESQHLAMSDIQDSIAELQFYRQRFLRLS